MINYINKMNKLNTKISQYRMAIANKIKTLIKKLQL